MFGIPSPRSDSVNATNCCHILSVVGDIAVHLNGDTKDRIVGNEELDVKMF